MFRKSISNEKSAYDILSNKLVSLTFIKIVLLA